MWPFSKSKSITSNQKTDKCDGCKHYDIGVQSYIERDGSNWIKCPINGATNRSQGCGRFSPDASARCSNNCYYKVEDPDSKIGATFICRYTNEKIRIGSEKNFCNYFLRKSPI